MNGETTAVELLLKRERVIVVCGLIIITGLAWWWLLIGAGTGMSATVTTTWSFPPPTIRPAMAQHWSPTYAIIMFLMWWIMMIAMMTPSAAPLILLYARAHRYEQKLGRIQTSVTPTFSFAAGYLLAWMAFSMVATGLQWAFEQAGFMHAMLMWSINPYLTASILIAAGVYQLSPLKNVCLEHCRSPAQFLAENYRPGAAGAFRMGLKHGLFCLGCCWFLMGLLFAGGIMNLVWIAGLALFVLLEKIAPKGHRLAQAAGMLMIGAGLWVLVRQFI